MPSPACDTNHGPDRPGPGAPSQKMEMETETAMEIDDSYEVRLNKCPFCAHSFLDEDRIIFKSHIQQHLDRRYRNNRCYQSHHCRNYRAENSADLADHLIRHHIRRRQCTSTSNRTKRATHYAQIIKEGLIRDLAQKDPDQDDDRPFAHHRPGEPRHRIENQQALNIQRHPPIDNPQHPPRRNYDPRVMRQ